MCLIKSSYKLDGVEVIKLAVSLTRLVCIVWQFQQQNSVQMTYSKSPAYYLNERLPILQLFSLEMCDPAVMDFLAATKVKKFPRAEQSRAECS